MLCTPECFGLADSGLWVCLKKNPTNPLLCSEVKFPSKPCSERLLFGEKKVLLLWACIASFVVEAIFLVPLLPLQDSNVWVEA